jgi:CubicO group peptidase (beta-lactamase class C family)
MAGTAIMDGIGNRACGVPDPKPLESVLRHLVTPDRNVRFGIPGAVLAVSAPDGATTTIALGTDAAGVAVTANSIVSVNSVTKLATALLILRLVEEGLLDLDAPLGDYLPDARAARVPGVTIRRLLSHTSGLTLEPPHDLSQPPGPLTYREDLTWPGALAEACMAAEPAQPPGSGVRYSNIGYGLLGLMAERIARAPFSELLWREVLGPLKIEAWFGSFPNRPPMVVGVWDMPTPYGGTSLEPFNSRTWYLLGAPWTGLSVTVSGLLTLVRAYLDGRGVVRPETALLARSDQTHGLAGGFPTTEPFLGRTESKRIVWTPCAWGLGVEVQGAKKPHWAPATLPKSFGQIGSSGCIGWCDSDSGIAWALLGARSTESGWPVIHGPRIAAAAFTSVAGAQERAD